MNLCLSQDQVLVISDCSFSLFFRQVNFKMTILPNTYSVVLQVNINSLMKVEYDHLGIGLLFMVTDLSNNIICAVVIFRVKVWPPLSRLLQPVTIRNSAVQGLHSQIGDHNPVLLYKHQ